VAGAILAGKHDAGERRNRCAAGERSKTGEPEPRQRVVAHEQQELVRHVGDSVHGRGRREQNAFPPEQPRCECAVATGCRVSKPVGFVDNHRPRPRIRRPPPAERFVGRHPKRGSALASRVRPLLPERGRNEHVHRPPRREREGRGNADVGFPGPDRVGQDCPTEPPGRCDRPLKREPLVGAEPRWRRVLGLVGQQRASQRRRYARRGPCRSRAEPCRERVGNLPE
jgi:hypothetical protein